MLKITTVHLIFQESTGCYKTDRHLARFTPPGVRWKTYLCTVCQSSGANKHLLSSYSQQLPERLLDDLIFKWLSLLFFEVMAAALDILFRVSHWVSIVSGCHGLSDRAVEGFDSFETQD